MTDKRYDAVWRTVATKVIALLERANTALGRGMTLDAVRILFDAQVVLEREAPIDDIAGRLTVMLEQLGDFFATNGVVGQDWPHRIDEMITVLRGQTPSTQDDIDRALGVLSSKRWNELSRQLDSSRHYRMADDSRDRRRALQLGVAKEEKSAAESARVMEAALKLAEKRNVRDRKIEEVMNPRESQVGGEGAAEQALASEVLAQQGLEQLAFLNGLSEEVRIQMQNQVDALRQNGVTWQRIADVFGISVPTVVNRFNPKSRERHRDQQRQQRDQRLGRSAVAGSPEAD